MELHSRLLAIAEKRTRMQNLAHVHIETISNMTFIWAQIIISGGVDFGTSPVSV